MVIFILTGLSSNAMLMSSQSQRKNAQDPDVRHTLKTINCLWRTNFILRQSFSVSTEFGVIKSFERRGANREFPIVNNLRRVIND